MKYLSLAFVLLLVASPLGYAQKYEERAEEFFKYANYEKALNDYLKLYRKSPNDEILLRNIIDCYLLDDVLREPAIPYIDKLLELKPNDAVAQLSKAKALFHGHKFDDAEIWAQKASSSLSNNSSEYEECIKLLSYIKNAKYLVQSPVNVDFINLGDGINTSRNELNPFSTYDETSLFYTSDKRYNSYAGIYYDNICVSELDGRFFEKGKTIGSYVNTIYDEVLAGIDPYGKMIYVHHNRNDEEEIAYSKYSGKYKFDELIPFGPPLDQKGGEYGVWMTQNLDTIYFSAETAKGDNDIFYALKLPSGEWGYARALPGRVNSSYNEDFPMLSKDGKRLYFSSDNEKSMGGHDLFYSEWNQSLKEWGAPINLGYPINDTYDNFTISFINGERHAYVSAIRPEGLGARDIYKIVYNQTEAYEAIIKGEMQIKQGSKYEIPGFSPTILVTDTLNNTVGEYKASLKTGTFLLVLKPGYYDLKIEYPDIEPFKERLEIPEKWYNNMSEIVKVTLFPKVILPEPIKKP